MWRGKAVHTTHLEIQIAQTSWPGDRDCTPLQQVAQYNSYLYRCLYGVQCAGGTFLVYPTTKELLIWSAR